MFTCHDSEEADDSEAFQEGERPLFGGVRPPPKTWPSLGAVLSHSSSGRLPTGRSPTRGGATNWNRPRKRSPGRDTARPWSPVWNGTEDCEFLNEQSLVRKLYKTMD